MLKLQYTESAESDIVKLSQVGFDAHGQVAVIRYNKLVYYTVEKLRENPEEIGTKESIMGVKMFHLRHFRKEVTYEGLAVKNPSHFICFRVIKGEILEVVRVLREEMDFPRHLI